MVPVSRQIDVPSDWLLQGFFPAFRANRASSVARARSRGGQGPDWDATLAAMFVIRCTDHTQWLLLPEVSREDHPGVVLCDGASDLSFHLPQ